MYEASLFDTRDFNPLKFLQGDDQIELEYFVSCGIFISLDPSLFAKLKTKQEIQSSLLHPTLKKLKQNLMTCKMRLPVKGLKFETDPGIFLFKELKDELGNDRS